MPSPLRAILFCPAEAMVLILFTKVVFPIVLSTWYMKMVFSPSMLLVVCPTARVWPSLLKARELPKEVIVEEITSLSLQSEEEDLS